MVSPKLSFLDWDIVAGNNTDINGIGILGTNNVNNFDDALRTIMAQLRAGVDGEMAYAAKSANYTAVLNDNNAWHRYTAVATVSLTAAATLGQNWHYLVQNDGAVAVTIDPNASETINGATTLVLQNGQAALIICTGTAFFAIVQGTPLSGPSLKTYIDDGLILSNNASDAVNDIDITAGAAAADTSPYYLMQLTSALTKRLDAAWAAGNGNGGLDTGAIANTTYHIWLIQRSDTGVVDALFSTSATAPTMPTNYDRKRRIGCVVRSAGAILAFRQKGNRFMLATQVALYSNSGTVNVNQLIGATGPLGVRFRPILTSSLSVAAASTVVVALGDGDGAAVQTNVQWVTGGGNDIAIEDSFLTNTSGQVRHSITTSAGTVSGYNLFSTGWWDDRGMAA